jgi:hypothetical protein
MLYPAISAEPEVGLRSVESMLMVVVLPAPFGPRKPKSSPVATEKEIPSTAVKLPNFLINLSTFMEIINLPFIPISRKSWV